MEKVESSNRQFSIFIVTFSVLRAVPDGKILDMMHGKVLIAFRGCGQ